MKIGYVGAGLFIAILILGWLATSGRELTGQSPITVATNHDPQDPNSQYPTVAGSWHVKLIADNKPYDGAMVLKQRGLYFEGEGQDPAGRFAIAGSIAPPDQIQFTKRYHKESIRHGAHQFDVLMSGKMETERGMLLATALVQRTFLRDRA